MGKSPATSLSPKLTLLPTVLLGVHLHPSLQTRLAQKARTTPSHLLLAVCSLAQQLRTPGSRSDSSGRIPGLTAALLNPNLHFNKTSECVCGCVKV